MESLFLAALWLAIGIKIIISNITVSTRIDIAVPRFKIIKTLRNGKNMRFQFYSLSGLSVGRSKNLLLKHIITLLIADHDHQTRKM